MANVRNSNTYFIDATGSVTAKNIKVVGVIFTASGAAQLIVKDVTTGATKLDLKATAANISQHFILDQSPIVFPNGIDVTTVTNCTATLILEETRSG